MNTGTVSTTHTAKCLTARYCLPKPDSLTSQGTIMCIARFHHCSCVLYFLSSYIYMQTEAFSDSCLSDKRNFSTQSVSLSNEQYQDHSSFLYSILYPTYIHFLIAVTSDSVSGESKCHIVRLHYVYSTQVCDSVEITR